MYEMRIQHPGLKAFRVIRDFDQRIVELRAQLQLQAWDDRWTRVQEAESKRRLWQQASWDVAANKQLAATRTSDAQRAIAEVEGILRDGIELDHRVDWELLKDKTAFNTQPPLPPQAKQIPTPPRTEEFAPRLAWFQRLIPVLQRKARAVADQKYKGAEQSWRGIKEHIEAENAQATSNYEQAVRNWETQKREFYDQQRTQHKQIDLKRSRYLEKDPTGLIECWETVLTKSEYPDAFPKSFLLEYLLESRTLIVEYALPSIACLPSVKEVKYIQVRSTFQEVPVSQSWLNKAYDDVLYQIALRTLYELFHSDEMDAVDSIVLNGWVRSIDKATGQEVNACVLSIQASKAEFMAVNLAQVEPKACFKKFKGISAAKLTEFTPIRPVLQLNREDRRFISPYEVAESLDSSSNIAAMDWQDFENLIRELFEKEFSQNGGEVKITQASRDGGVDAVAFDPDPIRGGKIVIQAKRYTNTVSVSAVRDLYGTVLNEGAMKGILVTTADYGRDAFEFAKDKPLTLLSGNELLYLLQKHGHRVKIDLQEARRLAAASK
jgi:restriction system protein